MGISDVLRSVREGIEMEWAPVRCTAYQPKTRVGTARSYTRPDGGGKTSWLSLCAAKTRYPLGYHFNRSKGGVPQAHQGCISADSCQAFECSTLLPSLLAATANHMANQLWYILL